MGLLCFLAMQVICVSSLAAQEIDSWVFADTAAGKHKGPLSALFVDGGEIYSVGRDGFLQVWDIQRARAVQRYQLSSFEITSMIKSPGKDEICLAETDGRGHYRITAWNYRKKEKLFSVRFIDPLSCIAYSANGSFIIAARSGRNGFVIINAQTGVLLKSPEALSASITFVATGRAERSMISYFSNGILSYWNLVSSELADSFDTLPRLRTPVLFGNSRFLAGLDSSGLAIVDAVSGAELARNNSIPADSLILVVSDELYCLVRQGERPGVYQFSMERGARLNEKSFIPVSLTDRKISSFAVDDSTIALGTEDGNLILLNRNGQLRYAAINQQTPIIEASVSGGHIAFLTENNELCFIPADYAKFRSYDSFKPVNHGQYTKISPVLNNAGNGGQFVLWQNRNTRTFPCLVSAHQPETVTELNERPLRFPLRTVQASDNRLMLLDASGNLSILPLSGTARPVIFSSVGAMDAIFIRANYALLCRSAVSGNTPFLMVNTSTGETIPLAWPAQVGVMAYQSADNSVYAVTIEDDENNELARQNIVNIMDEHWYNGHKTSIIKLDTAAPANSTRIAEYPGEDTNFALAETESLLAVTITNEGTAVYTPEQKIRFGRTPGFPVQVFNAGSFFVLLDTEGNISWHEPNTGRLTAIFKLYENQWILQTRNETIRKNF